MTDDHDRVESGLTRLRNTVARLRAEPGRRTAATNVEWAIAEIEALHAARAAEAPARARLAAAVGGYDVAHPFLLDQAAAAVEGMRRDREGELS